jgi:molybdopterin-containing oxidoreductase family iron-sulfur binding subunit
VGRATFFGNRNDPDSLIYALMGSARIFRLKEELGTSPAVYYLS